MCLRKLFARFPFANCVRVYCIFLALISGRGGGGRGGGSTYCIRKLLELTIMALLLSSTLKIFFDTHFKLKKRIEWFKCWPAQCVQMNLYCSPILVTVLTLFFNSVALVNSVPYFFTASNRALLGKRFSPVEHTTVFNSIKIESCRLEAWPFFLIVIILGNS
jgi:hypothetical protein